jgi:TPR repeat protein
MKPQPAFSRLLAAQFALACGLVLSSAGMAAFAAQVAEPAARTTRTAVADYNAGNLPAALAEFRDAARRGNRLAQFNYAMMLINGEGAPADIDEAKKWLRKAADAGMSQAQYIVGRTYDDGQFVGRDPVEAHRWFLMAARQGHVQAELSLANQFLDGRGTPRDFGRAFIWYKKAAQGGDAVAQYVTGSYYERGGDGVTKNLNVARTYYLAAAVQGDPVAKLKYDELSRTLADEARAGRR